MIAQPEPSSSAVAEGHGLLPENAHGTLGYPKPRPSLTGDTADAIPSSKIIGSIGQDINQPGPLGDSATDSREFIEQPTGAFSMLLNSVPGKNLSQPIQAIVEPDGECWIARAPDLPLYGYGDDTIEAIDMLREEILSLREELSVEGRFSPEWRRVKEFLDTRFAVK